MKKTHFIDLLRTIERTGTTWFAILIFFFTSATCFFGLSWSDNMTTATIDRQFTESHTRDVALISFYGLGSDAIDAIRNDPLVADAEAVRFTYAYLQHDGDRLRTEIRELSERLDLLVLKQGTYPTTADEAVIDCGWADRAAVRLGDTLIIDDGQQENSALTRTSFTVTGFVVNPAYSCTNYGTYGVNPENGLSVDAMLYTVSDAFEPEGGYQSILIRGADLLSYTYSSDTYADACDALGEKAGALAETYNREQYDRIQALYGAYTPDYVKIAVQTRTALSRLVSVNTLTQIMHKISYCLSLLFVVIALLVGYVAITRLVYLQQVQTGMKKAFGISVWAIVEYYIGYSMLALSLGCLGGVVFGLGFEYIIGRIIMAIYYIDSIVFYINWVDILLLFLITAGVVILICVGSVLTVCRQSAAELLQKTSQVPAGHHWYEKLPVWKRMSLLNRAIVNNCVTDKRRVCGTLISIACCMALFVCALTFCHNVNTANDVQFSSYFHFNTMIEYDDGAEQARAAVQQVLQDHAAHALPVCYRRVTLESKDRKFYAVHLYALPQDSPLSDYFTMEAYDGDNTLEALNGLYVGHAYRSYYANDSGALQLICSDGEKYTVTPDGYFLHYTLAEYIIMSEDAYEELFGTALRCNAFLLRTDAASFAEIKDSLSSIDGILSCTDLKERSQEDFSTFTTIVTVISIIYGLSAVLLAFLVLKNILTQFVLEKKNELITMKVNGYEDRHLRRYILVDTIILTVLGLLPGAVLGAAVGYLAICAFDTPTISLIKTAYYPGWLLAIALTVVISMINCVIAMQQISRFDITDINT